MTRHVPEAVLTEIEGDDMLALVLFEDDEVPISSDTFQALQRLYPGEWSFSVRTVDSKPRARLALAIRLPVPPRARVPKAKLRLAEERFEAAQDLMEDVEICDTDGRPQRIDYGVASQWARGQERDRLGSAALRWARAYHPTLLATIDRAVALDKDLVRHTWRTLQRARTELEQAREELEDLRQADDLDAQQRADEAGRRIFRRLGALLEAP